MEGKQMTKPYLCSNCKTNRTRFNLIQQVALPVKLNSKSGDIIEEYNHSDPGPFHLLYRGPERKVQCAACGLIEDEHMFIKRAETSRHE